MDEDVLIGDHGDQLPAADLPQYRHQHPVQGRPDDQQQNQDHERPHRRFAQLLVERVAELHPAKARQDPEGEPRDGDCGGVILGPHNHSVARSASHFSRGHRAAPGPVPGIRANPRVKGRRAGEGQSRGGRFDRR